MYLRRTTYKNILNLYAYSRSYSLHKISALKLQKPGTVIELKGWIKSLRKMKELVFFDITDGSSSKYLQVAVAHNLKPKTLSVGASVVVKGVLQEAPNGTTELQANSIEVCGDCDINQGYPFRPRKTYSPEYVREYLHFRPRTKKFSSLLRIRSGLTLAVHKFFDGLGYFNVNTPGITSNDCEGAGETFLVRPSNEALLRDMSQKSGEDLDDVYFGRKAYLSVSGQLQLEAAVYGLGKVYTFGPVFRAENSKSRLHLSEFYMVEAEAAFVDDLEEIKLVVELLMKNTWKEVLEKCNEEIDVCKSEETNFDWLDNEFPVLEYDECAKILEGNNFRYDKGLTKENELFLVKHCGNTPVFVVNWPKELKPFYARNVPEQQNKVAALDLLVPIVGELVGGSLREHKYETLKERIPENSIDLDWYLQLRKFGGVPTGGFGLGFERFLQMALGIPNIKDTVPFPRWPHNCAL